MADVPKLADWVHARSRRTLEEIRALPDVDSPGCAAHVQEHGHELTPETLVFLVREAWTRDLRELLEVSVSALIGRPRDDGTVFGGRTQGYIYNAARDWHFVHDRARLISFREAVHDAMWEQIFAGREEKPLWETRFGHVMRQLATQHARSLARRISRDRRLSVEAGRNDVLDQIADTTAAAEPFYGPAEFAGVPRWILEPAITRLPEPSQTCIRLRWLEGYQIESKKGKPNVCDVTGLTPRTIFNWIARGEIRLRHDQKVRSFIKQRGVTGEAHD